MATSSRDNARDCHVRTFRQLPNLPAPVPLFFFLKNKTYCTEILLKNVSLLPILSPIETCLTKENIFIPTI